EAEAAIGDAPVFRKWVVYVNASDSTPSSGFARVIARESGIPARSLIYLWPEPMPGGFELYTVDGWGFEDYDLWVAYVLDGRVAGYYLLESLFPPPPLFERIRAWFDSWTPPPPSPRAAPTTP